MAYSSELDIVRAGGLSDVRTVVRNHGGDFDQYMRAFGIDPEDLKVADKFVQYSALVLAMEAMAHDLRLPDFGLRVSALQNPESYGPLWLLMKSAPTVRDGIDLGIRHVGFYIPAQGFRQFASEDSDLECIEMFHRVPHLPDLPQAVENAVSQLCRFVLELSDQATSPAEIHFRHQPVSSEERYHKHFGLVPQFGSDFDGIALTPSGFRRRIADQSPLLNMFVGRFIASVTPDKQTTVSEQVSVLLESLVRTKMAELATVAALIGKHPRTLQRRLSAEGRSFEDLRDAALKAYAEQLLAQDNISLSQVAHMLGYSEQSVLTRACQRWYGTTPLHTRQKLRSRIEERCYNFVEGNFPRGSCC